jgi:cyclopropane fatty-acyl-phospholipid synthase-like methyltransferase
MQENRFDQEAAAWDENPARVKLADDVAKAIHDEVPLEQDMDVLDLGCGTGLVTLRIAAKVRSMVGADSSRGMLKILEEKIASQKLGSVRTLILDGVPGDVLGGPYNLIVSSMMFHHFRETKTLLEKLYAALKKSGILCVADLDPDGGMFHADNTGVFHSGFDREALSGLFAGTGFKATSVRTASTVTRPCADGAVRTFTIFLITGHK